MFKKSILTIILITTIVNGKSLENIIQSSLINNNNIKASLIENKSKKQSFNSVKNIYNPNIDIGINYTNNSIDYPETIMNGYIKATINLYDGGKNKAIKQMKNYEYKSSVFNSKQSKKDLIMNVITIFYNIKSIEENIKALIIKKNTLKAEVDRINLKFKIGMTTEDEVLKLKSEYETNNYNIEELNYQKSSLLNNLSVLSGIQIKTIDNSYIKNINDIKYTINDNIKALNESIKALNENIKVESSITKPQIKFSNSLNFYNYENNQNTPNTQNQLMITVNYKLFDTSSKQKKEIAFLNKQIKIEQLNQIKKQSEVNFKLSKLKLKTQLNQIKSAKKALDMSNSVFKIIKSKYENGIVDNITYLDALSKKIISLANYKTSLYNFEIAKANYYYYSGNDLKNINWN